MVSIQEGIRQQSFLIVLPLIRVVVQGADVVVVHVLAAADVLDDVADRALSKGRDPEPVLGGEGGEVAQQRMPLRSLECLLKKIDEL